MKVKCQYTKGGGAMGSVKIKCQICEGEIRNGRCRECGMPYRNDRKMYRLNETLSAEQKEAAARRMEQARTAKVQPARNRTERIQKQPRRYQRTAAVKGSANRSGSDTVRSRDKEKKPTGMKILLIVIIIGLILMGVMAVFQDHAFRSARETGDEVEVYTVKNEGDVTVDPETYPEDLPALPDTGEEFTAELEAGTYRVGWQIPAGVYTVSAGGRYSAQLGVTDEVHRIWLYQSLTQDTEGYGALSISDVRLYQGAEVTIEGSDPVTFYSDCADMASQASAAENPLTESFTLKLGEESMRADIPSGYYDLSAKKGWGPVAVRMGEEEVKSVFMGAYSGNSRSYRNFFIPQGATVYLEDEYSDDTLEVEITPSEYVYE